MNKRGQFYLIAAIVIIGVIVGFTTISNYSKKEDYERINILRDELQIETGQIIEYGLSHNTNSIERLNEINKKLKDVAEMYTENAEIENMFFILKDKTGTTTRIKFSWYLKSNPGNIIFEEEGVYSETITPELNNYKWIDYQPTGNEVGIIIDGVKYKFELKPGVNLYFIISKGDYIATNLNM